MFTAFDVAVGILVFISAILATSRGLTREVLSLATWAGSAAIAVWMWKFHPEIAREYIKEYSQETIIADAVTVIVSFILSLIVLHLITMRIADFVVDSKIGPLDRTLGFMFGACRGLLIAIVAVIFGNWLLGDSLPPWASESKSMPLLTSMGDGVIAMLPDSLEEEVSSILGSGNNDVPAEIAPTDEGTDAGEVGLKT